MMGRRRAGGPSPLGLRSKRFSPRLEGSDDSEDDSLGNLGLILVLFETPSGFAIFCLDGALLYKPNAMENIWANFVRDYRAEYVVWLKEYKAFGNKSSAITFDTGVNKTLAKMIMKYCRPGQILAVGKHDYKEIIQKNLQIPCLCNDIVMEVMWGLKNLMHNLIPQEKSQLTEEDRLPMSQGLLRTLDRYGFKVKPEMVNDDIIVAVCALVDCDFIEKKHSGVLQLGGQYLQEVSGINSKDWDLLKVATALRLICYPEEEIQEAAVGNPKEMFSADELSKFASDSHKYEDKIMKTACLRIYQEMVCACEAREDNRMVLTSLVMDAEETESCSACES